MFTRNTALRVTSPQIVDQSSFRPFSDRSGPYSGLPCITRLVTTPKRTAKPNDSTKPLNNTFAFTAITSKLTGPNSYPSPNSLTTTPQMTLLVSHPSLRIKDTTPKSQSTPNVMLLLCEPTS